MEVKRLRRINELVKLIEESYAEIQHIQKHCTHEKDWVTKIPQADVGNYDPSTDRYWYDCKCNKCGKFWTEDQ